MTDNVRCCKAGDSLCAKCGHEKPHKAKRLKDGDQRCTKWGDCWPNDEKILRVRCIKVKEEQNDDPNN